LEKRLKEELEEKEEAMKQVTALTTELNA